MTTYDILQNASGNNTRGKNEENNKIRRKLNSEFSCYVSVRKLSSLTLSKILITRIYKTILFKHGLLLKGSK
jgi:hypothetical protein